jgi:hypothetical protein
MPTTALPSLAQCVRRHRLSMCGRIAAARIDAFGSNQAQSCEFASAF